MGADERIGGEPTEEPTPKRLREARRSGRVAVSSDWTSVLVVVALSLAIWASGHSLAKSLTALLRGTFRRVALVGQTDYVEMGALEAAFRALVSVGGPLLGVAVAVALIVGGLQVGPLIAWEAIAPRWSRLSPSRLFSRTVLGDTGAVLWRGGKTALRWTLAGIVLFGSGLGASLRSVGSFLGATTGQPVHAVVTAIWWPLGHFAIRLAGVILLVAALDYWVVRRALRRQLRMTKVEVQREQREELGEPSHRAERQRLHRELLREVELVQVATASFVVINPTHLAVAVRYDGKTMAAPQVVASGERLRAQQIVAAARGAGVPIFRNIPLARSLFRLDLGDEIPEALYDAVAELLRLLGPFERR